MTVTKQTGIGNRMYLGRVGGPAYDMSGDIGAISEVTNVPPTLDVTGINTDTDEYLLGRSKGQISYSAFFNPSPTGHHTIMSNFRSATALAGTIALYEQRDTVGSVAAFGKFLQLGYKETRAANGALTVPIVLADDGAGPDWGGIVWTGLDATVATHTGVDLGAFGPAQTITAISAANPAVVTSVAHGLASGDTISISGSDSTPVIDGDRIVTVLTADTFSVPVNVTVLGTTGSFQTSSQKFGLSVVAMLLSLGSGSMTPIVEDSADGTTGWTAVTGSTITAMTAADGCRYVRTARTQRVRRFIRVRSTGTFTDADWRCAIFRCASAYD